MPYTATLFNFHVFGLAGVLSIVWHVHHTESSHDVSENIVHRVEMKRW